MKRDDPQQWNAYPRGTRVQFIEHFVKRLINKKDIKHRSKIVTLCRQKVRALGGFSISTQKFGGNAAYPELGPRFETRDVLGMASREINQARVGHVTEWPTFQRHPLRRTAWRAVQPAAVRVPLRNRGSQNQS